MTELLPEIEQQLADLSADEFDDLVLRVRPPDEPADPKQRAANALRRHRGLDRETGAATKESAAAALRRYTGNH